MNHVWKNINKDTFFLCAQCGMYKIFHDDARWWYYSSSSFISFLGAGIKEPTCAEMIMQKVME